MNDLKEILDKLDIKIIGDIGDEELEKISKTLLTPYYILINEISLSADDLHVNYVDIGEIEFSSDVKVRTHIKNSYRVDDIYYFGSCQLKRQQDILIKGKMRDSLLEGIGKEIRLKSPLEAYYLFENLGDLLGSHKVYITIANLCGLKHYRVGHREVVMRLILLKGDVIVNFIHIGSQLILNIEVGE